MEDLADTIQIHPVKFEISDMSLKKLYSIILICFLTLGASCDRLHEELEPCVTTYQLRITHKMNMKSADAFETEVKKVNVYVFDENENHVATYTDLSPEWRPGGYVMNLPDLHPGHYHFIAWCGDDDKGSFVQPTRAELNKSDLRRHLNLATDSESEKDYTDHNLDRLFHSSVKATLSELPNGGTHIVDMDLTKDTNTIRIMLQNVDGNNIDKDDFSFVITDHNSRLDHTNNPEEDTPDHDYRPFSITELETQFDPNAGSIPVITGPTGLFAEISTSRLMATHEPTLTIRNKTGETVLSINLIKYFDQIKGEDVGPMQLQEYLDRQDSYNLTLFLYGNQWQKSLGIYINSWKVVPPQTPDL